MVFGKTCSNNKKSLMPIDNHSINTLEKFQNRNEFNHNKNDRLFNEKTNLKTQMKAIPNQRIYLKMSRLHKAQVPIFNSKPFIIISLSKLSSTICHTILIQLRESHLNK
jgi:hypothetical protein